MVTDDATGQKYPLADYALTPDMAIVDANLVMDSTHPLCAFGGLDAVTHALEAYVSVLASVSSLTARLQALKLLKEYLPASHHEGSRTRLPVSAYTVPRLSPVSRSLTPSPGVCHSMAHKPGSQFHIPHGLANALLICNVIRYNANDNPTKADRVLASTTVRRLVVSYAEIADHLGLRTRATAPQRKSRNCWHGWKALKLSWVFRNLSAKLAFRKLTSWPTLINCLKMHSMTSAPALTRATR